MFIAQPGASARMESPTRITRVIAGFRSSVVFEHYPIFEIRFHLLSPFQ